MLDHPGAIQVPTGAQNGPKQHWNGPEWLKITRMAQNSTAWPQITLKHFPWVYYMIICHVGPPWALFRGPRGPLNGPKHHQDGPEYHQNGPSRPQMSIHDPKRPWNTSHGYTTWYCVIVDHPGAFSEAQWGHVGLWKVPKVAQYGI